MKNKKIYILAICLAVALTGCSLSLVKKVNSPKAKTNNVATTTEKIATSTESKVASSTDDMSKWKTFSNKGAGIEFKYPPTWPDLSIDRLICGNNLNCFLFDLPGPASVGWGHTSTYDNLPQDVPNSKFMCPKKLDKFSTCSDKISDNGARYYIITGYVKVYDDFDHDAFIGTGKTIVLFSFQGAENYNKKFNEYQKLLSSLKIVE